MAGEKVRRGLIDAAFSATIVSSCLDSSVVSVITHPYIQKLYNVKRLCNKRLSLWVDLKLSRF
jgi:hypothetical protein